MFYNKQFIVNKFVNNIKYIIISKFFVHIKYAILSKLYTAQIYGYPIRLAKYCTVCFADDKTNEFNKCIHTCRLFVNLTKSNMQQILKQLPVVFTSNIVPAACNGIYEHY